MFNLWDRHNYRNSWSLQFEHLIIINDTLVIKIIIIFCICLSLSGLTMSMWSPTTETILQSIFLTSDTGPHHLRSSLSIFSFSRKDCLTSLPWSCPPAQLVFIHTITSSLFPNSGINDVAEAGKGEVYTFWIYLNKLTKLACIGYTVVFNLI